MSFLDDMIAKGKDLLGKVTPTKHDGELTEGIKRDRFDRMDWSMLRQDVPNIDKHITDVAMSHDYVEAFFEDFYNILHQGDPTMHDKKDVDERYHPNVDMDDHFLDLPEVKSLRVSTMHGQYETAFAMLSMQSKILEQYERTEEAREQQEQARQERDKLQQMLNDMAEMLAEHGAMDPDEDDEDGQALQAALAEAIGEMAEQIADQEGVSISADTQAQRAGQAAAQKAEMDMRLAAKQADDELQEEAELFRAFGVEDGELKKMDYETRRKLAESLRNNKLARFAKLLGQFRNIEVGEVRRRITHAPDEVVGVELGDNLQRIVAGEMLNIAEPELEDDFWRRWADRELVQYKLQGKEKMGRGPIIVVCDESGSMAGGWFGGGEEHATPEAWSKAIALALCDRARRDGRDFHYIGFSSTGQVWHLEFPGGKAPIEKVIEFTEHFWGGGTSFETPLRLAMDLVVRYEEAKKPKPDIVFITDDMFTGMPDQFFKDWDRVKHQTSMRCFGILIGHEHSQSELTRISDNVRSITDLSAVDPDQTRDIFRTI